MQIFIMECRKSSKYAHQLYDRGGKTQSHTNADDTTQSTAEESTSDVITVEDFVPVSSQEVTDAFRQKKSTSLPARMGVSPESNVLTDVVGSSGGRSRSVSESEVERSAIELLQNLTSIIVCTRNTSSLTTRAEDGQSTTLQSMLELGQQSSCDRSPFVTMSLDIGQHNNETENLTDVNTIGEEDFRESNGRAVAVAADNLTHPVLVLQGSLTTPVSLATDETKTGIVEKSTPWCGKSSWVVFADEHSRSSSASPLSEPDDGISGCDVNEAISQIQRVVNQEIESSGLESRDPNTSVYVSDYLELTEVSGALSSGSTDTPDGRSEPNSTITTPVKNADSTLTWHQPLGSDQERPQEFNHETLQEFSQRSAQQVLVSPRSQKEPVGLSLPISPVSMDKSVKVGEYSNHKVTDQCVLLHMTGTMSKETELAREAETPHQTLSEQQSVVSDSHDAAGCQPLVESGAPAGLNRDNERTSKTEAILQSSDKQDGNDPTLQG